MGIDQKELESVLTTILDKALDTKLKPLIDSVKFINNKFDDFNKMITQLEGEQKKLIREN